MAVDVEAELARLENISELPHEDRLAQLDDLLERINAELKR